MSDGTSIEWTDATVNAVNGCSVISPGCANCYAMRAGGRGLPNHPSTGLTKATKAGHVWTGEVRLNEAALLQPLRWRRPRRVFWNAHGDMFHESVPDEWIDRCFAVMALTPQHIHQVLTKRPDRMRSWFESRPRDTVYENMRVLANSPAGRGQILIRVDWPLPNVWLGTSVEDQQRADERIPLLRATPAAVRFLSAEPLLQELDIRKHLWPVHGWWRSPHRSYAEAKAAGGECGLSRQALISKDWADSLIHWVIVGGESGPGARPLNPNWVRSLRDQCAAAEVPFFFKQWGEWFRYGEIDADGHQNSRDRGERPGLWHAWSDGELSVNIGKRQAGRHLDGVEHSGMPA